MGFHPPLSVGMRQIEKRYETVIWQLAMEIWNRIVARTPVDQGRARSNWFVTIGNPSSETTNRTSPSRPSKPGFIPPYPVIWISNNLPYIVPLEYGYSKQAPGGMVRLTLGAIK